MFTVDVKQQCNNNNADGSKQDEKVACAVISPNFTDSIRLPDNNSIFTAEAKAIDNCTLSYKRLTRKAVHHLFRFSLCFKVS